VSSLTLSVFQLYLEHLTYFWNVSSGNIILGCDIIVARVRHHWNSGATSLEVLESYKTPVPSSLNSRTLDKIMTFCSNNSRPVVFNGLPKDRCDELLGNLLSCIYENFRACDRPESYLARADVGNCTSETRDIKKVLVIGASNMRHCARSLEASGVSTEQITIPGWMCSPENVKRMMDEMETKSPDAGAFVFDLLSNSTLRFEQFDGTTSLPFKSNGKFHYGDKILVASNDLFKKLVVSILPILKAKGDKPCVILPPLPRSLFSQCCNDKNHCTNFTDKGISEELLAGYIRLRNELIKQLASHGLSSFKVMDSC
jgi:hypothetical protein